jgi:hypothetical protein
MAYELCSPPTIDKVLAETFDACLSEVKFQKIRPRLYVRTRFPEMNDVIEFFRGNLDLNFVWGLSLNFVPHITNGVENICWHRTPKSAISDLRYSGFGKNPETGWSIHTTQGEHNLRRSAELTRAEMLPKALRYFDSVRGFHDLSLKFKEAAHSNDWGWTLEMRYQVHLAYAFYLAKSGHESEARQMMLRGFRATSIRFDLRLWRGFLNFLKKLQIRRSLCSEARILPIYAW